nr:hypothetical protein CR513_17414 [Ipomoea batatas]
MNFLTSSSVRELFGERTTYATGTSPASASGSLIRSTTYSIPSSSKYPRSPVWTQPCLSINQNRQIEAFDFVEQLGNGDDELRATILDLFGKLWNCIHWIHGRGNGTGGDGAQEAEREVDGVWGEDKNDIVFPNTQLMLQAMSDFGDLRFQLGESQGPAGFLYFLAALTLFVAVVSRTLEASACSPVGRESANPRLFVVAVGFLQFLAALTLSVVVASRTPDAFACSPLLHTRDSSSPRLASKKQRDIDTIVYGEIKEVKE